MVIFLGVTVPIDGNLFFDDNNSRIYTGYTSSGVAYTVDRSIANRCRISSFL